MKDLTAFGWAVVIGLIVVVFLVGRAVFAVPLPNVDVCHQTGSEQNPWELININENALPAHLEHGDFLVDEENPCPPEEPEEPEQPEAPETPEVPEVTDEEREVLVEEFEQSGVK